MLVVLDEQIEPVTWAEHLIRDAGEELLGNTASVNPRFDVAKRINKCDLYWFFQAILEWIKLAIRIFEFVLSTDFGMVLCETILMAGIMHH